MKTRLLKKLRNQAKNKYKLEFAHTTNNNLEYKVVLCEDKKQKDLFCYADINEALAVRDKYRREDILHNLGVVRYHCWLKKYK